MRLSLSIDEFELPAEIKPLLAARDSLKRRYAASGLRFTLDGNLVGDIGEAVAAELFGLELTPRCGAGIDGMSRGPKSKSVQVKASGTFRGPAFRRVDLRTDHLLFFHLDFERRVGQTIFNGPEAVALQGTPTNWVVQLNISLRSLRKANEKVRDEDRLPRVG